MCTDIDKRKLEDKIRLDTLVFLTVNYDLSNLGHEIWLQKKFINPPAE